MSTNEERIVTPDNPLNGYSCYDYKMAVHSDGALSEQWVKSPKIHIEYLRQAVVCLATELLNQGGTLDYAIEDLDFYADPENHDEWNNKRHRIVFELCQHFDDLQDELTRLTRLYNEVNCFKGDRYQWFKLPRPMTTEEARKWAKKELDMPAEAFRNKK